MEILSGFGLWGMFVSAFLAATILPLGSEVVLGGLLLAGYPPGELVVTATTGNVLGSVVNYGIGIFGTALILERWMGISERSIITARERFRTWGAAGLLLAWAPVIGDPLTVVAGMLRVHLSVFLLLVTLGKLARYLLLSWVITNI